MLMIGVDNMKEIMYVVICLVLVVGCAEQQSGYVCPDGTIVSTPSLCEQETSPSYQSCNYNSDCPPNYGCVRAPDPRDNYCTARENADICGDGKCSIRESKQGNCDLDCP